jgi:hypothetical protein
MLSPKQLAEASGGGGANRMLNRRANLARHTMFTSMRALSAEKNEEDMVPLTSKMIERVFAWKERSANHGSKRSETDWPMVISIALSRFLIASSQETIWTVNALSLQSAFGWTATQYGVVMCACALVYALTQLLLFDPLQRIFGIAPLGAAASVMLAVGQGSFSFIEHSNHYVRAVSFIFGITFGLMGVCPCAPADASHSDAVPLPCVPLTTRSLAPATKLPSSDEARVRCASADAS